MSNRIFDRSNYSKKTLDTYEVISAYYVDMYYNHIYLEAKKMRTEKSVSSITDGYKHILNIFLQDIDTPKRYKKNLLALYQFFLDNGFTGLSFSACLEKIIHEFVPVNYYESLTNTQKNSIIRLVLNQANKAFIEKIAKQYMSSIIDNHMDEDNIRVLQDEFIDLLLIEREGMYQRFISVKAKPNQKNGHINTAIVDTLRNELKVLYKEKYELKKTITALKKIIVNKENIIKENNKQIFSLDNIVQELKNELRENDIKPVVSAAIVENIVEESAAEAEESAAAFEEDLLHIENATNVVKEEDIKKSFVFDENVDIWD